VHALETSIALLASTHSATSLLAAMLRSASRGVGDAACEISAQYVDERLA
jgi:hypothetical protein